MSLDVYLDCACCGSTVAEFNATHNLTEMASEAGCYLPLWQAPESGITHARQLIDPVHDAVAALRADPVRFTALNPANGWGTYDGFIAALDGLLTACQRYPDAEVRTWR